MSVRFQLRRGTAAEWTAANPILAAGEPAVETDTHREKLGDGTTAWNSLGYVGDDSAAVAAHEADTTSIHGIANTALLETTAGAQAKVDAAVAALLAGAPGALDTLNELAAALGNDANLASTLTAAIAAKVSDTAYNAGTWDGVTTVAPSKNAVRDKIEALSGASVPDHSGAGSPEGSVTAAVGSIYRDTTNGLFYVKKTGAGNTGWLSLPDTSISGNAKVQIDVFTAGSSVYTKPSWAQVVRVVCIAAGGGGGSGRKGAAGTVRCGGGGGGAGGKVTVVLNAADVGNSENVVVGTGGTSAAAVTASDTDGATGGNGGLSYFGPSNTTAHARANGGSGGVGGTNALGTGGAVGLGTETSTAGGSASVSGGTGGAGANAIGNTGGGAGGGITSADAPSAGGAAGIVLARLTTAVAAGAADANGSSAVAPARGLPGGGGGGGGGSKTTNGGTGGNGVVGGGGGGGGAALNAVGNSGAGGVGGDGLVVVVTEGFLA